MEDGARVGWRRRCAKDPIARDARAARAIGPWPLAPPMWRRTAASTPPSFRRQLPKRNVTPTVARQKLKSLSDTSKSSSGSSSSSERK